MTATIEVQHHPAPPEITSCIDPGGWVQARHPDDFAIVSSAGNLTYAALKKAIQVRAATFREAGLAGRVVALQRVKTFAYVIDLLALLSMRAIVMPLDPELPPARRAEMIKIAQSAVTIDDDGEIAINGTHERKFSDLQRADAAYIFFTSGSTGRPKPILGARQALRHFIEWQGQEFVIGSGDCIPFLTNIGFDVSLRDILLPLRHGARLVIPQQEVVGRPQLILNWMRQNKVTRLHAVPSIVRIWAQCAADPVTSLRTVFSAGEKLTSGTLAAIRSIAGPGVEVVNLYGPTETTLAKFFHRLAPGESVEGASAPVGQPLPDTSYSLGEENEIIISTLDASLGYLEASSCEHARFSVENGITTYRTGDIGELAEDGSLRVIGRSDDQIKINGVRLHLKEVEHVLSGAPMVEEVVVLAQPAGREGEQRLAAVWAGDGAEADSLRAYALAHLPRPIVPTVWHCRDALPLNTNGKTDRQKIAAALQSRVRQPNGANHYNRTVAWLCNTVAELLETGPLAVTDDFFALGGTSLHVAFLIGRIEEVFDRTLAFAEIFKNPELSAIAAAIELASRNTAVEITPVAEAESYALSPQQRRWWNIYMPFGNRSWATMVRLIAFEYRVDEYALREALLALVRDQTAMQLSLHEVNGEIIQKRTVPEDATQMPVTAHDFSALTSEEAIAALNRLRLEIANSEIPTGRWPLFRSELVAMPGGETILVFAMHHMISDGFSMGLIESALRRSIKGEPPEETSAAFNYLDYAAWAKDQEPERFGPGSEAERYWRHIFASPYRKHVFVEKWTGPESDRGQGYCCEVSPSLSAQIRSFARREKVTEFSVYFAAKFLAWHERLEQDDLIIGTPAAGRDIAGADCLVGNFISLCCVRSRPNAAEGSPADYVRTIMQAVAAGMTHQSYQYDTLVRSLGMAFEQDRFPLTTLFISYLNFDAMRKMPMDRSEPGFSDLGFAVKFDAMSYVREHSNCTSLQIQYRNNLFDREEICEFAGLWLQKLAGLTGEPALSKVARI
jgi:mycobactin peptide synthetase MbtE